MTKRYVLKGHYQGKTIKLGGFQFIAGALLADLTPAKHALLATVVAQWGAFPEEDGDGKPEVHSPTIQGSDGVQGGVGPQGEGPQASRPTPPGEEDAGAQAGNPGPVLGTGGGGPQEGVAEDIRLTRLRQAVLSLDPSVVGNWTKSGKPDLAAVERALGTSGVRRAQVEAVAPGFTRPGVAVK